MATTRKKSSKKAKKAKKKSTAKKSKKTVRKAGKTAKKTGASGVPFSEHTWFEPDTETTASGKNSKLATLLLGPWNMLAIVRVDRIEIGMTGWLATYRV